MKKRKKKPIKPITKKMFFLDVPIWNREICIIVGMSYEEVLRETKRGKYSDSFIKCIESDFIKERGFWDNPKVEGEAVRANEEKYFLLLRPFKNSWDWADVLSHECFHMTQFIGEVLNFWSDVEPPAYFHQWLTSEIRKICSGNKKL